MSTDQQPPVLSPAALERLREEHERLTTDGRRDISERLLRARELGDLSENAEYDQTKNDQAQMEARIRYLEWTIKNAIVQEGPISTDSVGPGMVVTLRSLDSDEEPEQYLLAQSKEERAKGMRTITTVSPLGQAIVGRGKGDQISYEAPGGTFRYEVVAYEPWDGS
ncbi:MAG TPA: transcription elongation factor GreA [Actinomycetota bacterium]|nr:transcription elongation factor GreA [Actinomycetota bacterium]